MRFEYDDHTMNFDQGFLENILTLAFTAILILYIFKTIEDRKLREQKKFDAEIIRQGKIIEAQVQFLDNMTQLLWEYQLLAIEVSYYNPEFQKDLYAKAVEQYRQKSASFFYKIRAEMSKALRLTSDKTFKSSKRYITYEHLVSLDMVLNNLIENQETSEMPIEGWLEFNQHAVFNLSELVDNALNNVAKELQLKGSDASRV